MNNKATFQSIVVAGAAAAKESVGEGLRATDVEDLDPTALALDDGWIAVRSGIEGLPAGVIVAIDAPGAETLAGAADGDGAGVLAAFLGGAIEAIGKVTGKEITAQPADLIDADAVPEGSVGATFTLTVDEEATSARLLVEPDLATELGLQTTGDDTGDEGERPTVAAASFPELGADGGGGNARDLKVLADVTMTVTVELGRTNLRVRELLGLAPGSVVELDQPAGAPVEILANGTTVARGDVVVVDDELGVRITEVVEQAS
jgi:flagellar motor switch protein FliN/FliY